MMVFIMHGVDRRTHRLAHSYNGGTEHVGFHRPGIR